MDSPDLKLVDPSLDYRGDVLAMAQEYLLLGNPREQTAYEQAARDLPVYLQGLRDKAAGVGLAPGQVPYNTYWLLLEGRTIVAASTLRHWLTPALEIEGGHIGYGTRPSARGNGFGTAVCALTLEKAAQRGLRRVLITCDSDNRASSRIIRANGGVFDSEVTSPNTGRKVSRYWVEL